MAGQRGSSPVICRQAISHLQDNAYTVLTGCSMGGPRVRGSHNAQRLPPATEGETECWCSQEKSVRAS